jgi:hypothetical protein
LLLFLKEIPEPLLRNLIGAADLLEDSSIPECSTMQRCIILQKTFARILQHKFGNG